MVGRMQEVQGHEGGRSLSYHSAECRARIAEILADDVGFFAKKMRKHKNARKENVVPSSRFPKCKQEAVVHPGVLLLRHLHIQVKKEKDAVLDSADVQIPLADGADATANESSPLSKPVNRYKENQR